MVIQHNLGAMNSNRMLNITVKSQASSTEKLSSGYRINRAADDAAGLSISEKMRKQIRGLTQASSNAQDGISMVQTADGALEEVHAMLQRGNELAVKAANGTLSDDDRSYIKNEIDQLNTEIDRVRATSKFNETYLFPAKKAGAAAPIKAAPGYDISYHIEFNKAGQYCTVECSAMDASEGAGGAGGAGRSTALADHIANELVPNAINQISTTFPDLVDNLANIDLDINFVKKDGQGGVLAYASCAIANAAGVYTAYDFSLNIDSDDFSSVPTGAAAEELESTIAHEITHTIMQSQYPKYMDDYGKDVAYADGATDFSNEFPKWFKEGMAQISGGGFPTNWNYYLANLASNAALTDTQKIDAYNTYLKDNHPANNEYGTGYLMTAYMGYVVAKGAHPTSIPASEADVRTETITGLNKIFEGLNAGKDLSTAVADASTAFGGAITLADIISKWNNPDADTNNSAAKFALGLAGVVNGGAGSFITPTLNKGGDTILGNTPGLATKVKIGDIHFADGGLMEAAASLNLHVGADATSNNQIRVMLFDISSESIGTSKVDFSSQDGARDAIDIFTSAIQTVSSIRSYYGAIQNRLEHTIANLDNVVENTTAAESSIRDTDMATEMVRYSNNNILAQAGQAMLAQANQSSQGVLSLLQG